MNNVSYKNGQIIKEIKPEISRLPGVKNFKFINELLANEAFFIEGKKVRINKYKFRKIETVNSEFDLNQWIKTISYIKTIHSKNIDGMSEFNLNDQYDYFRSYANIPDDILKIEKEIINKMNRNAKNSIKVFCHNDLHSGNIIRDENENIFIIDYDFAGTNYAMFDLVRFMSQNNIGLDDRKKLMNIYFEGLKIPNDKEFTEWEDYDNLFSLVWASAMFNKIGGDSFKLIYEKKLENLINRKYASFKY